MYVIQLIRTSPHRHLFKMPFTEPPHESKLQHHAVLNMEQWHIARFGYTKTENKTKPELRSFKLHNFSQAILLII